MIRVEKLLFHTKRRSWNCSTGYISSLTRSRIAMTTGSLLSHQRTALPFGGPEKAAKLLTFELPEINVAEEPEPLPTLQADIRSRPSFNRTPIGWVCSEDNSHIHMELDNIPFDGETDDL